MSEEVWEKVWNKPLITSDYSLKYLDFMEKIDRLLPENALVLEAGCGTGQALRLFSSRHTTIGLDISPQALAIARNNCTTVISANILCIPLKDATCDLVYNSGVIEHFLEPQNTDAVKEMARVTKKGGYIIVIVPNTFCPWYRLGKYVAIVLNNFEFGYEEDYSIMRLKKILEQCHVSVMEIFGLQAFPPLATNSRELLPAGIRKKLGNLENYLPLKQFYAYAVGIVAQKE